MNSTGSFFHFDSVAEKYRIEKIKTIGDAYMCAGGIPERNRTNPVEVVLAALEMQKYMQAMRDDPANISGTGSGISGSAFIQGRLLQAWWGTRKLHMTYGVTLLTPPAGWNRR